MILLLMRLKFLAILHTLICVNVSVMSNPFRPVSEIATKLWRGGALSAPFETICFKIYFETDKKHNDISISHNSNKILIFENFEKTRFCLP